MNSKEVLKCENERGHFLKNKALPNFQPQGQLLDSNYEHGISLNKHL